MILICSFLDSLQVNHIYVVYNIKVIYVISELFNDIEPQHEDIYTKLNLLSSMLNDVLDLKNSFHTNNNEPKSEK